MTGIHWHNVNLLDAGEAEDLVSCVKATHMLHLAWYTEHKKYWTSPANENWVKASLALAQAFRSHGGERAVMAGTCAEYDWRYGRCIEGKTPLSPATLYGRCKNALREKVELFSKEGGMSFAWGRIFFLYGPYEYPDRPVLM